MKFKVGAYVHNGYCRMKVIRESELKGYDFVGRIDPLPTDPPGAKKLYGRYMHVSYEISDLKVKELK